MGMDTSTGKDTHPQLFHGSDPISSSLDLTALPSLTFTKQENTEHVCQVVTHGSDIGGKHGAFIRDDTQVSLIDNGRNMG